MSTLYLITWLSHQELKGIVVELQVRRLPNQWPQFECAFCLLCETIGCFLRTCSGQFPTGSWAKSRRVYGHNKTGCFNCDLRTFPALFVATAPGVFMPNHDVNHVVSVPKPNPNMSTVLFEQKQKVDHKGMWGCKLSGVLQKCTWLTFILAVGLSWTFEIKLVTSLLWNIAFRPKSKSFFFPWDLREGGKVFQHFTRNEKNTLRVLDVLLIAGFCRKIKVFGHI